MTRPTQTGVISAANNGRTPRVPAIVLFPQGFVTAEGSWAGGGADPTSPLLGTETQRQSVSMAILLSQSPGWTPKPPTASQDYLTDPQPPLPPWQASVTGLSCLSHMP